jgi:hypothetical protein
MSHSVCPSCGHQWNVRFRTIRGKLLCTDCAVLAHPPPLAVRWLATLIAALVLAVLAVAAIAYVG